VFWLLAIAVTTHVVVTAYTLVGQLHVVAGCAVGCSSDHLAPTIARHMLPGILVDVGLALDPPRRHHHAFQAAKEDPKGRRSR